MSPPNQPVAFIGDVHGCIEHLISLLKKLDGRHLVFLGDLVDRGSDSGRVLSWVKEMYDAGQCSIVLGNHDYKLLRYLRGNPVKIGKSLTLTLDQIEKSWASDHANLLKWLETWPPFIETPDWIATHAAWLPECRSDAKEAMQLCVYGEVDKTAKDTDGYPVRTYNWRQKYKERKHIFHGHDSGTSQARRLYPDIVHKPNGAKILNLDTAACFGGHLSACLYPEFEIVRSG